MISRPAHVVADSWGAGQRTADCRRAYRISAAVVCVFAGAMLIARAPALAAAPCTNLSCPADLTVYTQDPAGKVVVYPPPTGTGNCTPVQTQGLPSGDVFPPGVTNVSFSDKVETQVFCTFTVTVNFVGPAGAPALGGPALGALVVALAVFGAWSARRRNRSLGRC